MENRSEVSARSWNDPPHLGYCHIDQLSGKRNVLNRRVPFLLGPQSERKNNQNVTSEGENLNNALKPTTIIPSVHYSEENSTSGNIDQSKEEACILEEITDDEKLNFVTGTLERLLNESSEKCEKKQNDINQRINLMKSSWDKMSEQVKNRMYALVQELSKGNSEAALKVHCTLMVENVREVKQWMVGVKHIIEMERKKHIQKAHS